MISAVPWRSFHHCRQRTMNGHGRDFDSFVHLAGAALLVISLCEQRENTGPRINFDLKAWRSFLVRFLSGLRRFRGVNARY